MGKVALDMSRHWRSLLTFLVLSLGSYIACVGAYALATVLRHRGQSTDLLVDQTTELPNLVVRLHSGNTVAMHTLRGQPIVVLFVDARVQRQREVLQTNLSISTQRPYHMLVIANDSDAVKELVAQAPMSLLADAGEFSNMLKAFKASAGIPCWLIFDKEGKLRARGVYHSDSLTYFIRKVVENEGAYTGEYVRLVLAPNVPKSIMGRRNDIDRGDRIGMIFLAKVNAGCPEFAMLAALKRIVHKSQWRVLVVLVGDLSEDDGARLRANFSLPFDFVRADDVTQAWWKELVRKFGLAQVNGTTVVFDETTIFGGATSVAELDAIAQR